MKSGKSATTAVPPLLLMTVLTSVRVACAGGMSSLVMVQVAFCARARVMVPLGAQSPPQTEAV